MANVVLIDCHLINCVHTSSWRRIIPFETIYWSITLFFNHFMVFGSLSHLHLLGLGYDNLSPFFCLVYPSRLFLNIERNEDPSSVLIIEGYENNSRLLEIWDDLKVLGYNRPGCQFYLYLSKRPHCSHACLCGLLSKHPFVTFLGAFELMFLISLFFFPQCPVLFEIAIEHLFFLPFLVVWKFLSFFDRTVSATYFSVLYNKATCLWSFKFA